MVLLGIPTCSVLVTVTPGELAVDGWVLVRVAWLVTVVVEVVTAVDSTSLVLT